MSFSSHFWLLMGEVKLSPSPSAAVNPPETLFPIFWDCKARVPATVLPWPVELADHSFPSTGLGSWRVALRSPEESGETWWPRLGPDTWRGLLQGKPGPAAVPIRAGKGPCASAPPRSSFAPLGAPVGATRPLQEKWILSWTLWRLPPPPLPSRLWLARRAKLSAAVGRLQGLVPAGNSRKKRVRSSSEREATADRRTGLCLSGEVVFLTVGLASPSRRPKP